MDIEKIIQCLEEAPSVDDALTMLGTPDKVLYGTNRACFKYGAFAIKTGRDKTVDGKVIMDNKNEWNCFSQFLGTGHVPAIYYCSQSFGVIVVEYIEGTHLDPYAHDFEQTSLEVSLAIDTFSQQAILSDVDPKLSCTNIKRDNDGNLKFIDMGSCVIKQPGLKMICTICGAEIVKAIKDHVTLDLNDKVEYGIKSSLYSCNCDSCAGRSNELIVEAYMTHIMYGMREVNGIEFENSFDGDYQSIEKDSGYTQQEYGNSLSEILRTKYLAYDYNDLGKDVDTDGVWAEFNIEGNLYYAYTNSLDTIYQVDINGEYYQIS